MFRQDLPHGAQTSGSHSLRAFLQGQVSVEHALVFLCLLWPFATRPGQRQPFHRLAPETNDQR